jgi:hypothetical protein
MLTSFWDRRAGDQLFFELTNYSRLSAPPARRIGVCNHEPIGATFQALEAGTRIPCRRPNFYGIRKNLATVEGRYLPAKHSENEKVYSAERR